MKTVDDFFQDILQNKQREIDSFYWGPWILQVPERYAFLLYEPLSEELQKCCSSSSFKNMKERILRVVGIKEVKIKQNIDEVKLIRI